MFRPKTSFQTTLRKPAFRWISSIKQRSIRVQSRLPVLALCGGILFFFTFNIVYAGGPVRYRDGRFLTIPILGTTLNEQWEQVGIVADVQVEFIKRDDQTGLDIKFQSTPGRFSILAQHSVTAAITRVAKAAALNTDSWTILFTLPYAGVTLYGESLSAMAALSVVALAKEDPLHKDIVLTGTVTPEGDIGTVGGVPLKIVAAYEQHFKRILIPEEHDVADGDWHNPFLMHVLSGEVCRASLSCV